MKKILIIVDVLILLLFIGILSYLFFLAYNIIILSAATCLACIWIFYMVMKYFKRESKSTLSLIQLLSENEEVLQEWYIGHERGLLIGKNHQTNTVDIDLTEADYAVLIEKQHAVLNCMSGKWFIEDLESRNGVGVKKAEDLIVNRLHEGESVELASGDRIYIGKTILQVLK